MGIVLRDYQLELVQKCSELYRSGVSAVLMQSATGSGKTRTAAYIVDVYDRTNRQVLWLVHREELLMQASLTFAEYGIKHRLICAKTSEQAIKCQHVRELGKIFVSDESNVVVASIWTIIRRLDSLAWLRPAQIVADECHLSLSETWRTVIQHFAEARLLGLSATPKRLDKQSFDKKEGGLYDEIIQGPPIAGLIARGNLAKFKVYAPPIQLVQDVKLRKKGGDYDAKDLELELDSPVIYGDVVEHYATYSKGKPAIAFCPTVKSSERLANQFKAAGFVAVAIDGNTDDSVRRKALRDLGEGKIDVVTSVSILVEGTDVPYATTAILLRRTESLSLYLQAVGRVLRPHPDKDYAIILDFVGVTQIHGLPDTHRVWTLSGDYAPKKMQDSDIEDVKIRTCLNCYSVHEPLPVCPECGYVYPIRQRRQMKQINGKLVEVTEEIAAMLQKKKEDKMEQGKARSLDDLLRIEKARGYKPGWARKIFKARRTASFV